MANTPLKIPELGNKFVDYRDPIWGDSYNWSWNRSSDQIKYLVIHHSVTKHEATPDDIALLHKNRGWGGIGYHFVITKDGMVYYVGDIGTARANVADMNEQVIGICMVGDFTQYLPSDEQIVSCHLLCKFFLFSAPSIPSVNGWEDVVGHKELQATACPGSSWDKSQDGDMWWRVKTGTPYTPPAEEEGENLEDKVSDLEDKIKTLNEALAEKSLELNDVSARLEGQERDNKDLSQQLIEARSERDNAIGDKKTLEGKIEALSQQVISLQASEKALRTQLEASENLKIEDIPSEKLLLVLLKRFFSKKLW